MGYKYNFKNMAMPWFPLILLVLLGNGVDCDRVEFYGQENYTYFLKEVDISGDTGKTCHQIFPLTVGSVKTNRCIMMYQFVQCNQKQKYDSIRIDSNTPKLPNLDHSDRDKPPQEFASFHVCSRELGGGPEVDVDFEILSWPEEYKHAMFRDVCGCENLEKDFVRGNEKKLYVSNFGNDIDLFEGEHCTGQTRTLEAGSSQNSRNLWNWYYHQHGEPVFDVRSFRPSNLNGCMKLEASLYKFVFEDGSTETKNGSREEKVKLATDSILRNNGAQSIVQEFSVASKVAEMVDYTTSTGFSNMHSIKRDDKMSTEVKAGLKFVADEKIRAEITAGYQFQRTDTGSKTTKNTVVNETTITVKQQITVQSCRDCVVQTFVKKAENFPIKYTAYSWVTGTAGGDRMSAQDVRSALRPEVTYLGDVDGYTVDIKVEGVMFAEYGISTHINLDCKKIPGCPASPSKLDKNDLPLHMEFSYPINRSG